MRCPWLLEHGVCLDEQASIHTDTAPEALPSTSWEISSEAKLTGIGSGGGTVVAVNKRQYLSPKTGAKRRYPDSRLENSRSGFCSVNTK